MPRVLPGLLSVFICFHFTSVILKAAQAHWMMVLGHTPVTLLETVTLLEPYLNATDFNQGYAFFSHPGPAHTARYRIRFDDGTGTLHYLADKTSQWPRLRYHRYFVLSSTLFDDWVWDHEHYRKRHEHILEILYRKYPDAAYIDLELLEHTLPTTEEILSGVSPYDERFFIKLGDQK